MIFKIILEIGGWGISYEIALTWISLYLTDDKSTLVQAMTWCPQAASHYLNKCRPRSMSTCGVPGPQWVNIFFHIVFLIISYHNTLIQHAFPLNHYIHISISASSVTCSSSTTKKLYLNMLSSKTNALLTHTLASFWRKQSCHILKWVRQNDYREAYFNFLFLLKLRYSLFKCQSCLFLVPDLGHHCVCRCPST